MKFKQKFGWVSHIFGQNWIVPRYQNTGWWVSDLQKSKMQYSRPCVCNLVPDPPPHKTSHSKSCSRSTIFQVTHPCCPKNSLIYSVSVHFFVHFILFPGLQFCFFSTFENFCFCDVHFLILMEVLLENSLSFQTLAVL